MTQFSLIIPCYNEAKGIPDLVKRCDEIFSSIENIEIIFVDNGSVDSTPKVMAENLKKPWMKMVRVENNIGYGYGILQGLYAAKGDMIGWTHADLQTDPADFLEAIKLYNRFGSDVFIKGNRYGRPLYDVLFTLGMSVLETILFGKLFWDVNAQPTVFPRKFFEQWKSPPHDFSLDLYAYYMARKKGLMMKRFPVHFGARKYGASSWNTGLGARIKLIKRTLAFSFNLRFKNDF